MPGLFLNKNLNKRQGPTGKTDGSMHPIEKVSCRRLLCLPSFSWAWSKLWLTCPWWRATRATWERVMDTFPSFSRLNLLCRRRPAACQAPHFKGLEQERPSQGQSSLSLAEPFSQSPCRSTLQRRLAGKYPRSPLNTIFKAKSFRSKGGSPFSPVQRQFLFLSCHPGLLFSCADQSHRTHLSIHSTDICWE